MKFLTILIILFLAVLESPSLTFGEEPLEALQQGIDEGISVLKKNTSNNSLAQKEISQKNLFEITRSVFDFEEFSRLVLASYLKKFTLQQQMDFVNVFSEFLGKVYLNKLQEKYRDEKVIYLNQEIININRALVNITVLWRSMEVPVKIRMVKRKEKWKAYDINVSGISAVLNYRAQFKEILRKESPELVIQKLKKKIAELG